MKHSFREAGFTEETGISAMKKLINCQCRFRSFASNDHMAFGAFEVLHKEGLSVPKDVSVGFDNIIPRQGI